MNRRIAVALILALLTQSFVPGIAMALRADGAAPQTMLICTADGIKQIVLDAGTPEQAPQVQHSCPCGVLCAGYAPLSCSRIAAPIVYADPARFEPSAASAIPIAGRAPSRHQVRAPPSSS